MPLPDIDELMRLGKEDPEALEKLRETLVQEVIDNADESKRPKLEGFYWKLKTKLNNCKNNNHRMVVMQEMFYDQLETFRGSLNGDVQIPEVIKKESNIVEIKND